MTENSQGIFYYHSDGLGSIVALTDAAQQIAERYSYSSIGEIKIQSGGVENPYTYTGREWDAEAGQFMSFDPILHPTYQSLTTKIIDGLVDLADTESLKEKPQKINPFVYVQNRPTALTDPSGLGPPSECSFYKRRCDQGDWIACIAYPFCKGFGDGEKRNCARGCLIKNMPLLMDLQLVTLLLFM